MTDPFEIVPIRNYGEDDMMNQLIASLASIRKQASTIKNTENRNKALEALKQFELWIAVGLREDRQ